MSILNTIATAIFLAFSYNYLCFSYFFCALSFFSLFLSSFVLSLSLSLSGHPFYRKMKEPNETLKLYSSIPAPLRLNSTHYLRSAVT